MAETAGHDGAQCLNCGSFVTQRYVKVFAPDDLEAEDRVRTCPNCRAQRKQGKVRPARGHGKKGQKGEISSYREGVADGGQA